MSGAGLGDQTLADFLRTARAFLRRRFKVILVGGAIGGVLALLLISQFEKLYESDILLRVEQPSRSPIEADPAPAAAANDAFIDGQVYIIESTEVLRDAVERAGLRDATYFQPHPKSLVSRIIGGVKGLFSSPDATVVGDGGAIDLAPDEAYAVRTLRKNLDVSRRGDTELIRITVTADDPRLAARAANAVGAAFEANRVDAQFDRASRVAGWLDERALELQRKLSEAEDAIAAFRIENNLISGEPGTTLSEQQLTQLNTELINTRGELAQRRAAYNRFLEVLATGGDVQSLPEVQDSEIATTLRARLLELERREVELGGEGASNPRLTSVREERATIEAQLQAEVARIRDGLANEVRTLEARENLVVEALNQAGGETGLASRSSIELRELERRADAYRALYERYLSNSGLANEEVTYLSSGIEIVDPATVPETASFPPTKLFLVFGLIFGGIVGAVYAGVREAMLPGFMTARQVTRVLGLPVYSAVPQLSKKENPLQLTADNPMSAYAEAIRTLRHELVGAGHDPDKGAPVVLLTSSGSGEGKTTLAAALATSAASGGKNVLLIDADLRRGTLSKLYDTGEEEDFGLTDVLQERAWGIPDLMPGEGEIDFLPTGTPVRSPTDLLANRILRDYLEDARLSYDLIVVDGPPVANMSDAPILARLADAVAFVVRWNETPRDVVGEAIERLGVDKATLGVALNAVDLEQAAQYGETYGQYVMTPVQNDPMRRRVAA